MPLPPATSEAEAGASVPSTKRSTSNRLAEGDVPGMPRAQRARSASVELDARPVSKIVIQPVAGTRPITTLDSGFIDPSVAMGLVEGAILSRDQAMLG